MWSKCKSLRLTSILLKIVFLLLIIAIFTIPIMAEWYDRVSGSDKIFIPLCMTLYSTLIPGFVVAFSLNKLLLNIRKELIFVDQNVTILRVISWCCFIVSIIFLCFGFLRELAFLIAFAAAFFGLILRVLKNVFEQAVAMRVENDFTI